MIPGASARRSQTGPDRCADRCVGRSASRLLASVVAAGISVVALGACGGSADSTTPGGSFSTSVPQWSVDVAAVDAPTMGELRDRLGQEPAGPNDELQAASIPADVFGNENDQPDTSRPEWTNLITSLCTGEQPLLALADTNGWTMTVTGYVDTLGPQGPGTLNDHLDQARADAAAQKIGSDCGTDSAAFQTLGGGIHPDDIRVVVVSFTPKLDQQEEAQ